MQVERGGGLQVVMTLDEACKWEILWGDICMIFVMIFMCITHVVKATLIITLPLGFIPHVLIF